MVGAAKRLDGKKLKLPNGARYWFTANTPAGDFDIVLVPPETYPDMKGKYGLTLTDLCLIALDDSVPMKKLVLALFHELGHACGSAPGDIELQKGIWRCKTDKLADQIEEDTVTFYGARYGATFFDSGLLKLPPIPRKRGTRERRQG